MAEQGKDEDYPFGENFKIGMGIIQNMFILLKDYKISDESVFAALLYGTSIMLKNPLEQTNLIRNMQLYFKAIDIDIDFGAVRAMISYVTDNTDVLRKELETKLDFLAESERDATVFRPKLFRK